MLFDFFDNEMTPTLASRVLPRLVGIMVCAGGFMAALSCQPVDPALDLYQRAEAYLMSEQSEDGRWRSKTHAVLRSGQVLTPFITTVLLEGGGFRDGAKQKVAQEALLGIIGTDHRPGFEDPILVEYPTYATALLLRALTLMESPNADEEVQRLTQMLVADQFTAARGISPEAGFFGGWGFGEANIAFGEHGMVDLSHTRRVLEALSAVDGIPEEVYGDAKSFLRRMQVSRVPEADSLLPWFEHNRGGFYFSPVSPATNKGGGLLQSGLYNAYATTTCDGILALLAAGAEPDDPGIKEAMAWLNRNPGWEQPAGISNQSPWYGALFYYHLAVRAEVYHRMDMPGTWRTNIYHLLSERIQEDGSFVNPLGAANKEDDPLVATTLALSALQYVLENPTLARP